MNEIKKLSMQPTQSSLHELLDTDAGTAYHIPLYQRDYKWSDVEVEDFLRDAFESFKNNRQRFFGTVLLSENAPQHDKRTDVPSLYVIDGQQRLTTTLLILTAMRHLAIEIAEKHPEALSLATRLNDRITVEGIGQKREPRLFANRVNSQFMTLLLAELTKSREEVKEKYGSIKPKKTQRRCESLFNAYNYCYKYVRDALVLEIQDIIVEENSEALLGDFIKTSIELTKATDYLDRFRLHFLRNSLMVKIQITDWQESFELFDGLNNRGMELAAKDVLKNVILSRAAKSGDEMVDKVEKQWQSFDDYTSTFDFNKFLRHWLLLENSDVSLGGATRMFMAETQDEPPMETVNRLVDAALCYSAIDNPSLSLTSNNVELRHYINLKTMSAQRVRPIMLAALLKDVNQKEKCEILNALEILHFRRSAICQLDNKTLEVSVQKIASYLFEKGTSGAKKVISDINKLNPPDEVFKANFNNKSGMPSGISRYMLLKIENHLRAMTAQPEIDSDDVTLEHILPQKPEKHWKYDPSKPEVKVLIGRLGNLTLLRGKENSEASNLDFTAKKKLYGEPGNTLIITKEVVALTNWNEEEIKSRQAILANYALQIWSI
jgi:hypothetical protein